MTEILRDYGPYLWRALLGLGVSPSDVEDACQEVFIVVHRRLHECEIRMMKSWLYGICLRVSANYRRSARVRREQLTADLPERATMPEQVERVDAARLEARLLSVLDQLDDEKREAFVLFEVEQLTIREVAEATGVPLQTAYSRLQAARETVRSAFAADRVEVRGGILETG